ncbi:MAG: cytochrome c [Pseudomonadales bacterium]|nr:cytochrome c [Pseudomonadales bacterium]
MRRRGIPLIIIPGLVIALALWLVLPPSLEEVDIPDSAEAIARGQYLVHAGGCISCHQSPEGETDALSGGLALESAFGTFYASNLSPDPETGIGNWTGQDFIRAIKHGRNPNGAFYYPAFPYRAYAGFSDQKVLDIAAYLLSQPAVKADTPEAEVPAWMARWQISLWNRLDQLLQRKPELAQDPLIARGAWLARTAGHCGECHTPRNRLGMTLSAQEFGGAELGDDHVEAIDAEALEGWTEEDFALFLLLGLKADGEFVGGEMELVIEHNTSKLTDADRQALAAFFIRGQR